MASLVCIGLNSLSTVWSALISDPIKSIGAFASIGTLILSWKNLKKDATKVVLNVKRRTNGLLALQRPPEEYIDFEVYNQGTTPVVINEIGITTCRNLWSKQFINLVELPDGHTRITNPGGAIASLDYVQLPGTIPARERGIFLLHYSRMRAAYFNYQNQEISPESPHFVGSQRLKRTYEEFQRLQERQGSNLQIIPYVLTGSGERFVGRKACVRLGILSDAVV